MDPTLCGFMDIPQISWIRLKFLEYTLWLGDMMYACLAQLEISEWSGILICGRNWVYTCMQLLVGLYMLSVHASIV